MSQQMLQTKLTELAEHMDGMQRCIHAGEEQSLTAVRAGAEEAREAYAACAETLRDRLTHSRSAVVGPLAAAYDEIDRVLAGTQKTLRGRTYGEESVEAKMLLAEYEMDFAMLAIDRAVAAALDAIAARLALTGEEEKQ